MKQYLFLLPLSILAALAAFSCSKNTTPKVYRDYYTPQGQISCADVWRTNCGYSLRDCTVPANFDCITNIATGTNQ